MTIKTLLVVQLQRHGERKIYANTTCDFETNDYGIIGDADRRQLDGALMRQPRQPP
jgi:hypothetical protein